MNAAISAPPDVRAAIGSFLNDRQAGDPFALSHAMTAIRRIFPDLGISDADLADVITSEALSAGLDIDVDVPAPKGSLDRWDNEGGAIREAPAPRTNAERLIDNDTDGTRRRAQVVKDTNRLI